MQANTARLTTKRADEALTRAGCNPEAHRMTAEGLRQAERILNAQARRLRARSLGKH